MAKKRILKIRPVLVTLNIIVLLIIMSYYSFRLIKYYRLEHGSNSGSETKVFVDNVKSKQSYLSSNDGLIYNEDINEYRFKGNVNNNYVSYSGMLFRIISIDNNNNIKMISEDNLTIMYSGLENGYSLSYVNKWLNKSGEKYSGIFENSLYNSKDLLINTSLCEDNINDTNSITCSKTNASNKVTLLSLYDYMQCGGNNSFLNNGNSFYLSTLNDSNNNYIVENTGSVSLNNLNSKTSGVRAVITINGKINLISGKGSESNPYIIESHDIQKLNQVYVGDYILYSNSTYRVIEVNDDKVKVALDDVIKENNKNVSISFSSDSNVYSTKSNIGKYLNNTYYKTLLNPEYIVSSDWYTGKLSLSNLDYSLVYSTSSKANIGLLGLADFYVQDINNVFTLSKGIEDNNIINVINSNGNLYGDLITSKYNIRPSFYLNGSLSITSGIGSKLGPYVLSNNN